MQVHHYILSPQNILVYSVLVRIIFFQLIASIDHQEQNRIFHLEGTYNNHLVKGVQKKQGTEELVVQTKEWFHHA